MKKEKILTHREMKETVIHRWFRPEGYNFSTVCLHSPLFKMSLNVVFGDFKEFKNFIKNKHDQNIATKHANAMYVGIDEPQCFWHYINIQKNNWLAEDYGVLCHELHHFVHGALEEKGCIYGSGGEEVYAYMQGYFMELLVRAFIELKKNEKKRS